MMAMIGVSGASTRALTTTLRYSYIPISNYRVDLKPNPKINAKFLIGGEEVTTRIELFENKVPKTAGNFKKLFLGVGEHRGRQLSLANTSISRIYPNSHVEFGDLEGGNWSIYGERFADESWEDLHDVPGLLSSVSEGNTNSSRFILTLGPCPAFDYKNVIFGRIIDQEILKALEAQGTMVVIQQPN